MDDERSTSDESPGPERADSDAQRHVQHVTGMSAEAARMWVAFTTGRHVPAPRRDR